MMWQAPNAHLVRFPVPEPLDTSWAPCSNFPHDKGRCRMAELTIREIIGQVISGQIRVPAFQRGFVWDADKVAYLMDSIYKQYPIGSVLFWRTRQQLKYEKQLGSFKLPRTDPALPLDYILDGQQRITSLFGVFQTEIRPAVAEDWTQIYFDYRADPNAQDSQFVALATADVDANKHFLLRTLFDTVEYRKATKDFDDELAKRIDKVQSIFKEARIPTQTISTEDKTTVAIVFERVNQRGVELNTLQLLSAWAWSEEFDLQRQFEELATELEPFGFEEVGLDTNLILRCCAAVLANNYSTNTLINLNGSVVRERFGEVVNGIKGAIDFLRDNLHVYSLRNLPYPSLIVPLAVFFSIPGEQQFRYDNDQRKTILRWFWRTSFTKRYNSQPNKTIQTDIEEMRRLRDKQKSNLDNVPFALANDFFTTTTFRIDAVGTKAFVLMLAQKQPLSFISGGNVSLGDVLKDYNRNQFHHLYPRAFPRGKQLPCDSSCLANFCFLSQADNNAISGNAPSAYRAMIKGNENNILSRAICPPSLFMDNFATFVNDRSSMLSAEAARLMQQ